MASLETSAIDIVKFQGNCILALIVSYELTEWRVHHFFRSKPKAGRVDRCGDAKERPSSFLFELPSSEVVLDRHPRIRMRIVFEVEALRAPRVFLERVVPGVIG